MEAVSKKQPQAQQDGQADCRYPFVWPPGFEIAPAMWTNGQAGLSAAMAMTTTNIEPDLGDRCTAIRANNMAFGNPNATTMAGLSHEL